ncbi:MAG: DUF1987 domain-containing protein [Bacteroidia bacterium]|nr:DUF1987 domain-containing protein [Bacteroidia bacterium]
MERLHIEASSGLPLVDFNPATGELLIKGKSVPENGKLFFERLMVWINEYSKSPHVSTHVTFHLEFFNISSSKSFLFLMYKLMEMKERGHDVRISWIYSDAYILGAGRDYAYMVRLPFEFTKAEKAEIAAA